MHTAETFGGIFFFRAKRQKMALIRSDKKLEPNNTCGPRYISSSNPKYLSDGSLIWFVVSDLIKYAYMWLKRLQFGQNARPLKVTREVSKAWEINMVVGKVRRVWPLCILPIHNTNRSNEGNLMPRSIQGRIIVCTVVSKLFKNFHNMQNILAEKFKIFQAQIWWFLSTFDLLVFCKQAYWVNELLGH